MTLSQELRGTVLYLLSEEAGAATAVIIALAELPRLLG